MASFSLNSNWFSKCAPALGTNIGQCGTVTQCEAIPMQSGDLSVYLTSNDFRVMEALLFYDFEIRMCETVQNGLYEFLMANKVNMSKRVSTRRLSSGLVEVAPYVLARQYSPINNDYWKFSAGSTSVKGDAALADGDLYVTATSTHNIPADIRSFPAGLRVFIESETAGGASSKTAWVCTVDASDPCAVLDGTEVHLSLTSQNDNYNVDDEKIDLAPVNGLLRRGTPNVNAFEKWCNEAPSYLNWKNVPFWTEESRTTMCKSSLYDKWRKLVMEGNPLYREFYDLDEIAKNRQLAQDWQKRWVNAVFWNKGLANQTMAAYNSLDDIDTYDGSAYGLGTDGAACVGKRANAVGIYEQLAECGRVYDCLRENLNLGALFRELYNIMRVRESNGRPADNIDIFTDSVTALKLNRSMIEYYDAQSGGRMQFNVNADQPVKPARFGFNYRSYKLFWPNVTINIITHYHFDDWLAASKTVSAQLEDAARVLWILDFAGIYPGILASKRVVNKTGDLKALAAVNPDFACVMDVPTREQTLTSLHYTVVVECPSSNLIIENFSSEVPDHLDDENIDYSSGASLTTTTSA